MLSDVSDTADWSSDYTLKHTVFRGWQIETVLSAEALKDKFIERVNHELGLEGLNIETWEIAERRY